MAKQQGKIVEKLLPPFPSVEAAFNATVARWFQLLQLGLPKIQSYSVSLDLASVPATTIARQSLAVSGLTTRDIVIVNPPSLTAGLEYISARVSAVDKLEVVMNNTTGGAIDEGAATWLILAVRR